MCPYSKQLIMNVEARMIDTKIRKQLKEIEEHSDPKPFEPASIVISRD